MRIAAVVHNGVKHDARVLKGAASLKAQGHDVRLFGLTADETEDFVLPNGVPVHLQHRDLSDQKPRMEREELPPGRESAIWTSFRIQGETIFESVRDDFEPDIVHMHDHLALAAAAKYKQAFGCPLIWDAHEIYEDLASIEDVRAAVNARIIRENVRYVNGFITLNQSISDFYREKYPSLPDAVLVPNAVERVAQTTYDGRLHKKAGLNRDQKILLFQGGYSPHRGISALLEASRHLREDWSLVFMGWGKLEDDIRAYLDTGADRPAGRAAVTMVPSAPHDELLMWTAGATLGTIPYENTGLNHLYCSPNKLWEYPAAGVPILASNMPEMKKKIEQYQIGLTVNRRLDPEEIAEAVNALSDADLQQMRLNCGTYAAAENWQNYEARLTGLHLKLAEEFGIVKPEPASFRNNLVRFFRRR
ncbi:glycosyltransferase [Brachybacterium sp. GCM10030252]|uniref:glycosyltransferase n=1 Tax=Brachybacterium sp. GCM10030252 TaxID=3273380 RepID=UPI00362192F2